MKDGKLIYSFQVHVVLFTLGFITPDSVAKIWDKL